MRSANVFWIFWTGFSLVWMLLVAFATISIYITNQQEYELLSKEGIWVEGRLLEKWVEVTYDDDDDGGSTTTHLIKVQYAVPDPDLAGDKRIMEMTQSIPYDIHSKLEKGGRLKIIYAESDPEIFRIESEFVASNEYDIAAAVCPPFFGLPFLLLGLWGLKYGH